MIKEHKLHAHIFEKLPILTSSVKELDYVQALYLFGSLAREELKPLSDIDLAVLLDKSVKEKDVFNIQLHLTNYVSKTLSTDEFDLVILNHAPLRFAYSILKEGKLLFIKDELQLVNFRESVVKFYLDFLYYRKSFNRAFMEGIGLYGRKNSGAFETT